MPDIMYPKDDVHDFLFYDDVVFAHEHGIKLDFHIRHATNNEMEKVFDAFLDVAVAGMPELPHAIIDGVPDHRWRHTSNFQKAIRMSDVGQALLSAHWLIDNGFEDQFWKRLAVVVAEDVGFGAPYLTAMTLYFTRHKKVRSRLGPRLLDWIMFQLCRPDRPKSRDLTDLFIWSLPKNGAVHQEYEAMQAALEVDKYTPEDIKHFAIDQHAPLTVRMAALWCYYPRFLIVEGLVAATPMSSADRAAMMDAWGMPGLVQYIFHWGNSATGFGLGAPAPLVWELLCQSSWAGAGMDRYHPEKLGLSIEPATKKMHGIYAASFDMHNRDGKRAIAYFRKSSAAVKNSPLQSVANYRGAVSEAVFYAETGLLMPRLIYEGANDRFDLCRDGYFYQYGLKGNEPDQLIRMVAAELPALNKAREVVVE